jgi:hypothetical protein
MKEMGELSESELKEYIEKIQEIFEDIDSKVKQSKKILKVSTQT